MLDIFKPAQVRAVRSTVPFALFGFLKLIDIYSFFLPQLVNTAGRPW